MNKAPKLRFKEFSGAWERKKLKDLCSDFIVPMRDKPQVFDGNIPWCRIEDIEGKYLNGTKSNQYVSKETIENMNLKVYPEGTLICSCSASIGNNAITTKPLITNQTFIGLVCDNVNNEYLYYLMGNEKRNLEKIAGGTTIPYISRKKFEEFSVTIPLKEEQEKIASFFSLIDDKISIQGEKVEALKDYKKGMMQKIFSRELRFKDDDGRDYPEWEEKMIGEIASICTGKRDTQDKIDNGTYPFFVRSQIIERINSYSYDGEAILTAGDGVGVGKVFHYINGKFDYHQRVYKISDFSKTTYGRYVYEYFRVNFIREAIKYTAKTSVDSVRMEMITKMKIPYPILDEQIKIANVLKNIDLKIEKEQSKLDSLNEYKKGLLQQMFV